MMHSDRPRLADSAEDIMVIMSDDSSSPGLIWLQSGRTLAPPLGFICLHLERVHSLRRVMVIMMTRSHRVYEIIYERSAGHKLTSLKSHNY